MTRPFVATLAAVIALAFPTLAAAQAASDQVKQSCRATAAQIARTYMVAKKNGAKDLEATIYRASTNWGEQVAHYMAQVANRSDSITESELASLGTAYCVERRPAETDSR